ncbi:hypothetical protein ACFL6U_00855 [Planctomycetota bacterium]
MYGYQNKRAARAWVWILIAVLILSPILGITVYRITGDRALRKRIDTIRAQGHPVTLEELAETYNLPPGTENTADYYLAAFSNLVTWEDTDLLQDLPLVGKAELPPRTKSLPPIMKERIDQYLTENQEALRILHQAATMPHCRFPMDFARGMNTLILWMRDVRPSTKLLELEILSSLESGRTNEALTSVHSSMTLLQNIYPAVLNLYLARSGLAAYTQKSIERILNRTALSEKQLQRLSERLRTEDVRALFRTALHGDRCMGLSLFLGTPPLDPDFRFWGQKDTPSIRLLDPLRTLGYLQRDALGYLDYQQTLLETLTLPSQDILPANEQMRAQQYGGPFTRVLTGPHVITSLVVRVEAQQQTALTALAIERYRLAQQRLPEQLDQLVPDYLETGPIDPYDGQPLRYRLLDTGYVVYSIGVDGKDDGGKEKPKVEKPPWDFTFTVER